MRLKFSDERQSKYVVKFIVRSPFKTKPILFLCNGNCVLTAFLPPNTWSCPWLVFSIWFKLENPKSPTPCCQTYVEYNLFSSLNCYHFSQVTMGNFSSLKRLFHILPPCSQQSFLPRWSKWTFNNLCLVPSSCHPAAACQGSWHPTSPQLLFSPDNRLLSTKDLLAGSRDEETQVSLLHALAWPWHWSPHVDWYRSILQAKPSTNILY